MESKEIAGQVTLVFDGPARPQPKLPPPTVGPGYLENLLARLASDEKLPIPPGKPESNVYTVSWQAHREAERIEDPALIPQIAEYLQKSKNPPGLEDLAFVLTWFIKNTGNKPAEKLLGELLKRIPPKFRILRQVFWSLDRAPTPEVRAFARKHIPHKSWDIEGSALEVLAAAANPWDFQFLSKALLSGKLHESNLAACIEAAVGAGEGRAKPILEKFIKKYGTKSRKHFVLVAKEAIEQ